MDELTAAGVIAIVGVSLAVVLVSPWFLLAFVALFLIALAR